MGIDIDMDPRHQSCRVLLLDTSTGGTARDADRWPDDPAGFDGFSPWWWSEGNGSCDCNRARAFGDDRERHSCLGEKRYLVIGCSAPWATFREMNEGYPDALLAEFEGYWKPWEAAK